jgi:hypothetical protein
MALRSSSALPITGRHEDSPEVGEKSEYVICVAALRGIDPSFTTNPCISLREERERVALPRTESSDAYFRRSDFLA